MAEPTDAELLAAARQSLQTALQTGHSVTFNGRTYTAHELGELRDLIAFYENALNGGGAWVSRVAAYCKGA